ncbi:MAG TPA: HAMP domain-containing sensor histidine kinase, partial [Acidobacteriota bacterium]
MFKSIGTKILVLFISNVIGWVSLLGVFFYFIAAKTLERQVDSNLKETATVLASQWDGSLLLALSPGMEKAALYRSFSERLKLLKERTQVNGIYLASTERTNIVSSDPALRIGQPLPRLDLLAAELEIARRGEASASRLVRVNDTQYKSAIAPIYAADRVVAFLMIDMSPWYLEYLNTFKNSLLIFTAIALFCCALSARWFSKTITTPISQMVQRVEEIGKAQYEQPLEMKGKDEIATLAKSIETMRQNILHRDVQMKMMLSGIAHEIRNPLGGMELFAGILDNEKLTEHQRVYVAKITAEIQNLKRLLNDFLEFAKPKKLELEEISVPDLIG